MPLQAMNLGGEGGTSEPMLPLPHPSPLFHHPCQVAGEVQCDFGCSFFLLKAALYSPFILH